MRNIAIVGAGQAGLQLGIGLLKQNYRVTLVSNRTATEFLDGYIMSSQAMFSTSLNIERELKLNFWENSCPKNCSVSLTIATNNDGEPLSWKGYNSNPFQAIDQRLKFSRWLTEFECLGGSLQVLQADIGALESLAQSHDLTIVSGGKGSISQIFSIDEEKTVHKSPARSLACMYVNGMKPALSTPGLRVNIIPGVGEYFTMPGLTINGPCEMMLFEGIPGGAFDCWDAISSPEQQIKKSIELLQKHVPWEAERCHLLSITDKKATLCGRYTPVVRQPIATLPSGNVVYGIGDTVVLNDPVAGQGANNASKCAALCLSRIVEHGTKNFNTDWMQESFNQFWNDARHSTQWTNLLLGPLPEHIGRLLVTAKKSPALANLLADAFDNLGSLFPWIEAPSATEAITSFFEKNNDHLPRNMGFKAVIENLNLDESSSITVK